MHWNIKHYWKHQTRKGVESEIFEPYDNFECRGLLTLNEYVELVNRGIFLKNEKDKMGRKQLEELEDGEKIRYVRINCLFKGRDRIEKYKGKGKRCKGCSKFMFKLGKKATDRKDRNLAAQVNLDVVVSLQRVIFDNSYPVIMKERSQEEILSYREDLAELVTSTSSQYFRDTVQRVLDQEEIMSNKQSGASVKIKMMYNL